MIAPTLEKSDERLEVLKPTEDVSQMAKESSDSLAQLIGGLEERTGGSSPSASTFEIRGDGEDEVVVLPASVLHFLKHIMDQLAAGNGLQILPHNHELTTSQAAAMLNVSRPHLVKLLEKKEIPCRMVGTHRRILAEDLMNYKRALMKDRKDALKELSALSEKLGFDDEED